MDQNAHLVSLMHHMAWADARVWQAVLAHRGAREDAFLLDTLYHVHLVQLAFRCAWAGVARPPIERSSFADAEGLARWGRETTRQVVADVERIEAGRLAQPFRLPWASEFERFTGRPPGAHTLGESVLQVAMHSQHHRGQVCRRLREVGATPPYVDYIIWLWGGRPQAGE